MCKGSKEFEFLLCGEDSDDRDENDETSKHNDDNQVDLNDYDDDDNDVELNEDEIKEIIKIKKELSMRKKKTKDCLTENDEQAIEENIDDKKQDNIANRDELTNYLSKLNLKQTVVKNSNNENFGKAFIEKPIKTKPTKTKGEKINKENKKNIVSQISPDESVDYNKEKRLIIDNTIPNEKDKTYIFAMGGLEEIGKNMYVIEHNDEIIVVDVGIKFAPSYMLGVNGIIPNFDYFKVNNKKITRLIITHGHEDHIGGMPFIVQATEIEKICSPLLAAELIKRRLAEFKEINKIPEIETFSDDSVIKTKYFEIDFFRVCHSIPDCFGMCIKTPNGNIVSAGDYRFDFGRYTDDTNIHKIIEMSNRGIDVFLAESTNSDQPGFSESEDSIIENITSIIKNTKGRIFVSTFASNLGRIERVIEKGINLNRKVCVMGRSMEANIKASRKIGYIKLNDTDFLSTKEIASTPDDDILVVLTGSQGEEMAALNLMAEGKYPKITLKPTDTILLSSNPIPGNFKSVETLVNKLFKLGVNVIQHSPSFKIHASGHATRQEQQMMMKLINPKYIVPIHGEAKMLNSMRNNAMNVGFKKEQIILATNGQKIILDNHELKLTNNCIDAMPILIDRKQPSKNTYKLVEERQKLSENGVFMAYICIDKEKRTLYKQPMLATRGCFYAKNSANLIAKIAYSIKDDLEELLKGKKPIKKESVEEIVSKNINLFIWKNKKKNPIILTTIIEK